MLGAVGPSIIRVTIITAMPTEVQWDDAIVVLIECGVVLRDFMIIDVCKMYYFIYMYGRYLLTQVQISLQLNSEAFGSIYLWCDWASPGIELWYIYILKFACFPMITVRMTILNEILDHDLSGQLILA